jgi:hypothetical protein
MMAFVVAIAGMMLPALAAEETELVTLMRVKGRKKQ